MTNKEFARVIERLQNKDIGALKFYTGSSLKESTIRHSAWLKVNMTLTI